MPLVVFRPPALIRLDADDELDHESVQVVEMYAKSIESALAWVHGASEVMAHAIAELLAEDARGDTLASPPPQPSPPLAQAADSPSPSPSPSPPSSSSPPPSPAQAADSPPPAQQLTRPRTTAVVLHPVPIAPDEAWQRRKSVSSLHTEYKVVVRDILRGLAALGLAAFKEDLVNDALAAATLADIMQMLCDAEAKLDRRIEAAHSTAVAKREKIRESVRAYEAKLLKSKTHA